MNVFYPRLLDGNLNVLRRIEPVRGSLDMELEPLSSAELELQPGDSIPERSWVAVFTAYGLAGIFRSKPQRDRYGERSTTVSLVHGATELNDYLTGKTDEDVQSAANTAIQTIFSSYHGSLWTLGTVSPTASVVYGLNNSGVLDALVDLMEQLPGYMVTFDQTVTPWTVNIVPRPSEVTAEGRLSRNIQSVEITRDDSSLYTKVYYGENNSYVQDTTAVQKYGVIEHRISDSGYTDVQLAAMAQAYLDSHKAPKLSVSISAIDLSQITGEPLDQINLGSKYRLVIPDAETEENRVIEQIVCSVRYDDFLTNPNPQITLASDPESIITFLKQQRRSGGAGRAVKQLEEKVNNQYQHWTTENEVYKESVYKILGVTYDNYGKVIYIQKTDAQGNPVWELNPDGSYKLDENGEKIPVYETDAAGNPIPVYDETSNGSITGKVVQTAQNYNSLYQMTLNAPEFDPTATYAIGSMVMYNGTVYRFTAAHTGEWTGTDVTVVPPLQSQITQNATEISNKVSQGALSGYMKITALTTNFGNSIIDAEGNVKKAEFSTEIVNSINSQDTTASTVARINADYIVLSGQTIANYFAAHYLEADSVVISQQGHKTITLANATIDTQYLNASEGVTASYFAIAPDTQGGSPTELQLRTTTVGNNDAGTATNTKQLSYMASTNELSPDSIIYSDFPHSHSVTVNDQTGGVTLGSVVAVGDSTANFNIADTAFYQNHVGIDSATLFAYSDDPLDYADWTKDATGTLVNKYGLIKVVTNKDPNDFYFIGIDASSGTGGSASIDDITAQSITPDQTRTTVTIKATGTNVSDRTEDATLVNTTYTDGGFTYPCVTLSLDNTVIGRISTQSTYTSGETAGKNATNVVKGTWSNGSITYTTNAPSPNASAPKTLTLTTDQDSSWTWTAGDGDSGNYQKQVYVRDSAVTNPILTEPVDMPDTKVVVESKTKQDSWWKTTGDNAYKYVIPAFTATDYLSSDSSNQHGLATGTNNPTVIDPSEAIAHGFGICHDSIGLSESTQTLAAGASVTVYPKAKATKDAESATNITTAGITITAASAIDPKVSRGNWTNGSLTFTAGTTGSDDLTLNIKGGAQTPNLTYTGTEITGISFDVMEDDGTTAGADTGADITAAINKTKATLQANYDSTNSKFVVSRLSGNSFNIGLSNAIQIGINELDIPVTIGSNVIGDPHYEGDGVYSLSATGTITVGSHGLTVSGTDTFTATDAIALGLRQAGENLTVSPTNQPSYDSAINIPEVGINSNGYYFVKIGSTSYKKFHAPSGGSGSSDRRATFLEQITLVVPENRTRDDFVISASSIPHYENPTSIGTEPTSVQIDAWDIYQAGVSAGTGATVDVVKGNWQISLRPPNVGNLCTFSPSIGTGETASVLLKSSPQTKTKEQATATANISITDYGESIFSVTSYLVKGLLDYAGYVYLSTSQSSLGPSTILAKIPIDSVPGADSRYISTLSPIKLSPSDISTSTKQTTATFDIGDPQENVPISIDASDVYTKGLTDGSRLNIEELCTITQPLTQNTTYTFKPSDYKDVMRAITFDVEVPVGVQSSGIIQTDESTTYNGWSANKTESIDEKYCRVRINPYGTEAYYFKIDAHEVYDKGVAYGANTAGYQPVDVVVQPSTPNKFRGVNVPTGTDTVRAVSGNGAIYQVNSNGAVYLRGGAVSKAGEGEIFYRKNGAYIYLGTGKCFITDEDVATLYKSSTLRLSPVAASSYTVATGSTSAYIPDSKGTIELYPKGSTVTGKYYIKKS